MYWYTNTWHVNTDVWALPLMEVLWYSTSTTVTLSKYATEKYSISTQDCHTRKYTLHAPLVSESPSLIPRPSPAPVFDRLQYSKTEQEGLVNLTTWSVPRASHFVTLYMYGRATEKTDLAFCTSYEDKRRRSTTSSVQNIPNLEDTALKGFQTTCVKYPQWQNWASVAKKKPFLEFQRLQRNHP